MQRRWYTAGAIIAGFAMLATACTGGAGSTAGGGGTTKGEIIIASDQPTSGGDASDGLPAQNGIQFAVESAGSIKGFKLTFKGWDDTVNGTHDPQKGAQNIQEMISDAKILGMIGPNNSNVARAMIPIANRASFTMISAANTNECLTQTFAYCEADTGTTPAKLRPNGVNNYFRVAAADTFQGPAAADFVVDTLKLTKVAVWSDNETFGKGVADKFTAEITKKGGTVVLRQDFDTKTTNDWKPFLTDAKNKGAQAVYAGATSGTKICIPRAQMKGILDAPRSASRTRPTTPRTSTAPSPRRTRTRTLTPRRPSTRSRSASPRRKTSARTPSRRWTARTSLSTRSAGPSTLTAATCRAASRSAPRLRRQRASRARPAPTRSTRTETPPRPRWRSSKPRAHPLTGYSLSSSGSAASRHT